MLVQLLMSLNWQSVLVLHHQELDVHFGRSLEASGILIVDYNIDSFTEENLRTILLDVETMLDPRLNVLIVCDVTSAVSVLHQLSRVCGTRSNSSVDLCHVSQVLVVGTSDDLPVLLDSNLQVENMAVYGEYGSRYQGNSTKSRMWTLIFHPDGRAFTDVALFNGAVRDPTDVFPNLKYGYNGRQLTAVMKDNSFGYGDIEVNMRKLFGFPYKVLNLLADAMNVSFRIIPPREDEWGKNVNGSWTGLIGMLQRREADLAADILTIHSDRTSVTDYILPPICETRQVIMYKQEDEDDQDIILLRPFSLYVYIVFGACLMACIIFLSSCILIQNNEFESRKCQPGASKVQTITQATFEILGATLKQGSRGKSSYNSDRILVAGWWLFTTVTSAVYCGAIMTVFAIKLETPPFSNVAELAAKDDYKIGYDSSSITENILQNSKKSDVRTIKRRVQDLSTRDPDVYSSNGTKHLQRVWDGHYAYMTDLLLTGLNNASCKLKVINTKSGRALIAFHVPKWSPFKHDFRNSMSYISDSGLLHKAFQEWFPPTSDGCSKDDFPKAVSLAKIQSIFLAVGGGVASGFMILAVEVVWYKTHQKLPEK
ncbi:probable glutamate receptor [Haliotis asinina]|uniref:probable glutamate receptor n=1 Tax=Haliotis asinina TaxID=109174 RepID=UPI003531B9DD